MVVDAAGKSVDAVAGEQADIGFYAIDPARGAHIAFSAPYLLIEGCYLARDGSPLRTHAEVDDAANRVVVGHGSAYDLFLTRSLRQARILRAPTSPAVVDTFLAQQAQVAAGVKQQREADARRLGGLRLLDGHFMVSVRKRPAQAMTGPARRSRSAPGSAVPARARPAYRASG